MLLGYLSSMLPSELTALFLFLLLLVLVIYLINAIAFYNLAVRYGVPSPWMSFVPILNVYQTGRFINAMLPDVPPLYQRFSHISFCLLTLGGYAINTIITLFVPQLENLWSIFYLRLVWQSPFFCTICSFPAMYRRKGLPTRSLQP